MFKTEEIIWTDFRICFKISKIVFHFFIFQIEYIQHFLLIGSCFINMNANNNKKMEKNSDVHNNSKYNNQFYKDTIRRRSNFMISEANYSE